MASDCYHPLSRFVFQPGWFLSHLDPICIEPIRWQVRANIQRLSNRFTVIQTCKSSLKTGQRFVYLLHLWLLDVGQTDFDFFFRGKTSSSKTAVKIEIPKVFLESLSVSVIRNVLFDLFAFIFIFSHFVGRKYIRFNIS